MIKLLNFIKQTALFSLSLLGISQGAMADNCKRPPNIAKLDYIACPYDGLSKGEKDGKYGFVDSAGRIVIDLVYDDADSFSEQLAYVQRGRDGYFIDTKGNIVIALDDSTEVASDFKEGLVMVKRDGQIGFMDKSGNIAIPFIYDNASDFRDGAAVVVKDDLYGFIDSNNQPIIPLQYHQAMKFSEGLAAVRTDAKWGFIDKTGKLVIAMQYDHALPFDNGVAQVEMNDQFITIDKHGNIIDDGSDDKSTKKLFKLSKLLNKVPNWHVWILPNLHPF